MCGKSGAGVRIWSIAQGELTARSDVQTITNAVEDVTSGTELREKARRTARGMFDVAKQGFWTGGAVPPYGYDLSCVGPDSREHFRVLVLGLHHRIVTYPSGERIELRGKGHKPGKAAKIDRYRLVPSEVPERIQVVRDIFRIYQEEAISLTAIAQRLNLEGRFLYGKAWSSPSIKNVLENPLYRGSKYFNRRTAAAYQRIPSNGQGYIDAEWVGNKPKYRKLPKSEWQSPALVDERVRLVSDELFEEVQTKLAGIVVPNRAPRSAELWLAPFLVCESCGGNMRGWAPLKLPNSRSYFCGTFDDETKKGQPVTCRKNRVQAILIEQFVSRFLEDYGQTCRAQVEAIRSVTTKGSNRIDELKLDQLSGVQSLSDLFGEMKNYVQGLVPEDYPSDSDPEFSSKLIRAYKGFFTVDQDSIRSELLEAEDHLGKLIGQTPFLEAGGPAHRALIRQIGESESKVKLLESRLVPFESRLDSAIDRMIRLDDEITKVRSILEGSANRAKAEALGKILRRILVRTKPNPKQGGRHPGDLLEAITFEPVSGESKTYTLP